MVPENFCHHHHHRSSVVSVYGVPGTMIEAFHALSYLRCPTIPQGGYIPTLHLGKSHGAKTGAELGSEAMCVFRAHAFKTIPHFREINKKLN